MSDRTDPLQLLFQALVAPQPAVQVVITSGTWVEYCLHRLLRLNVPFPDSLGRPELTGIQYAPLVRLTTAMGVVPIDVRDALLEFGRIRNRFAHDITTTLVDADVVKFYRSFPADIAKALNTRPPGIAHFQWALLLLCQELHRLLPDEEDDNPKTFVPEDRGAFFEVFVEMMIELDDGDVPADPKQTEMRVIPLDKRKRR